MGISGRYRRLGVAKPTSDYPEADTGLEKIRSAAMPELVDLERMPKRGLLTIKPVKPANGSLAQYGDALSLRSEKPIDGKILEQGLDRSDDRKRPDAISGFQGRELLLPRKGLRAQSPANGERAAGKIGALKSKDLADPHPVINEQRKKQPVPLILDDGKKPLLRFEIPNPIGSLPNGRIHERENKAVVRPRGETPKETKVNPGKAHHRLEGPPRNLFINLGIVALNKRGIDAGKKDLREKRGNIPKEKAPAGVNPGRLHPGSEEIEKRAIQGSARQPGLFLGSAD